MPYELAFSDEALNNLKKLENSTAKRILDKIEESGKNPSHFFERLAGREDYKLRVGDYRILAKILQNEERIFVFSIEHRKKVYKNK